MFGLLKKTMTTEIAPLIQTGVSHIQKVEWLTAYVKAHERAFSKQNIESAFRGSGIHPFQPSKALQ
jgi:hypothetical protein